MSKNAGCGLVIFATIIAIIGTIAINNWNPYPFMEKTGLDKAAVSIVNNKYESSHPDKDRTPKDIHANEINYHDTNSIYYDKHKAEKAKNFYSLSSSYMNNGDTSKAIRLLKRSAKLDNVLAQKELGKILVSGMGVKKDFQKGINWLEQSAAKGNIESQYYLGNIYYFGNGVEKNLSEAISWYDMGAQQGDALSQFSLSICYLELDEGAKNERTVYWMNESAKQGCEKAQNVLGEWYLFGYGVEKNMIKAALLTYKAKEKGVQEAINTWEKYELSKYYHAFTGDGVLVDVEGNTYKTVKIGNQEWMAENLQVTRYQNGDHIQCIEDDRKWERTKTGAYCFYGDDSDKTVLYNWYAVNDNRKLAPEGWRIPTQNDWQLLKDYLGDQSAEKLKSTVGWKDDRNGNDYYGFAAFPFGVRTSNSYYMHEGIFTSFWSSDAVIDNNKAKNTIYDLNISVYFENIYQGTCYKTCGNSVRCIKKESVK